MALSQHDEIFSSFSLSITITSSLSGKNLKLANTFSDGIVFQRDKPINIWGSATPNKPINSYSAMKLKHLSQTTRENGQLQ